MGELHLYLEHATFVHAALGAWSACLSEKWVVVCQWPEFDVSHVFLLEIQYFAVYTLQGHLMRGGENWDRRRRES